MKDKIKNSVFIYDSLSRDKRELKDSDLKIYSCGVTVYDHCHIGHARSLYVFDMIRRYLKYRGYNVKFVRNITDIDDKIINKAKELNVSADHVAQEFTESYRNDLRLLGIDKADKEPKATENIKDMVKHIAALIKKGYAYESKGDVYFSVREFKDYGKLSGQSIDQMLEGAKKSLGGNKKDPLDFALWKKSKEGEPFWPSPWGNGRPGWHIECSTMSMKYLNTETLDIHAGGRDLIFPHHENEIAQAEALTGKQFAKYWIHHGLLTVNEQKMAKSSGNFITVKDFKDKYSIDVLKFFFLQTHYSQPIDFTWERMEEKRNALNGIIDFLNKVKKVRGGESIGGKAFFKKIFSPKEINQRIKDARIDFEKAMDRDFNTPNAVAVLFEIKSMGNKVLHDVNFTKKHIPPLISAKETIEEFGKKIFGLSFEETSLTITEEDREKINRRKALRDQGMYKEADQIRKELEERGIILEDVKNGKTT